MEEKELRSLIKKYLNKTSNPEERTLIEDRLSSVYNQEQGNISNEDEVKNDIFKSIIEEQQNIAKPKTKRLPWSGIAASLLLFIGVSILLFSLRPFGNTTQKETIVWVTKKTEWGQKSNIQLSDGSLVHLNSGSTLKFIKDFNSSEIREVVLDGEAFFEVTKNPNKPFVIKTSNVTTQVLGTSFNINSYSSNQSIVVTVKTGKVQVQSTSKKGDQKTLAITPNQRVTYNHLDRSMELGQVSNEDYLDWKQGIIRFRNTPMYEVADKLSQWYGVDIQFESNPQKLCSLTGTYTNAKLQVVLESIKHAANGLEYEMLGDGTILFKGFCEKK